MRSETRFPAVVLLESAAITRCCPAVSGRLQRSASLKELIVPRSVWPSVAGVALPPLPLGSTSDLFPVVPRVNTSSSQLMDSAHDRWRGPRSGPWLRSTAMPQNSIPRSRLNPGEPVPKLVYMVTAVTGDENETPPLVERATR